jgi:hypothetical protein
MGRSTNGKARLFADLLRSECGSGYNSMMAMPARSPGTGTYFVTSVTSGRRRLFQVVRNAELLIETLQVYRTKATTSCMRLLSWPTTFTFCLPLKGWPSSVPSDLSKVVFRDGSNQSWQSGSGDSQIIGFAMRTTSRPGASTSIKIRFEHTSSIWRRSMPIPRHIVWRQKNRTSGAKAQIADGSLRHG